MRRFHFSLARLLRVRRLHEELARGELAQARGRARGARSDADEAAAELERGRVELLRLQGGPRLQPEAVLARHAAQDGVARARGACERRAQELEREAEARRSALIEVRAAVRGLERLRERRRALHAAELERAERLELDEVAQRRPLARLAGQGSLSRAAGPTATSSAPAQSADEDGEVPRADPGAQAAFPAGA